MRVPAIGDVVRVLVDPAENGGLDIVPGVVTRVWSAHWEYGRVTVNVWAFLDAPGVPPLLTSIHLYEVEAHARTVGAEPNTAAFLPSPRVSDVVTADGARARAAAIAEQLESAKAPSTAERLSYLDAAGRIWLALAVESVTLDVTADDGPRCRSCGADCSRGRSYDGGGLYACGACSDARAERNRLAATTDEERS